MNHTKTYNTYISLLCDSFGLKLHDNDDYVLVDRTSMVENCPNPFGQCSVSPTENQAYTYWFDKIESAVKSINPNVYISWGCRTDDYFGIEVWI